MFEPFATTKREGVGLGLAVCKQVASRLGGTLHWVRERNRTVFILRIRTCSKELHHDSRSLDRGRRTSDLLGPEQSP